MVEESATAVPKEEEFMEDKIMEMIVDFIAEKSKIPKKELTPDTEIYDSNVISSLSLLELISLIETKYSIAIEAEDLIEDNFKNISTVVEYVGRKLRS